MYSLSGESWIQQVFVDKGSKVSSFLHLSSMCDDAMPRFVSSRFFSLAGVSGKILRLCEEKFLAELGAASQTAQRTAGLHAHSLP